MVRQAALAACVLAIGCTGAAAQSKNLYSGGGGGTCLNGAFFDRFGPPVDRPPYAPPKGHQFEVTSLVISVEAQKTHPIDYAIVTVGEHDQATADTMVSSVVPLDGAGVGVLSLNFKDGLIVKTGKILCVGVTIQPSLGTTGDVFAYATGTEDTAQ